MPVDTHRLWVDAQRKPKQLGQVKDGQVDGRAPRRGGVWLVSVQVEMA
jgi:hypothetical protein